MRRVRLGVFISGAMLIVGMVGFAPVNATTDLPALPTAVEIEQTLVAKGIDLDEVVWQTGANNYVGPNCPGAEWTCAPASTPVVQQSTASSGVNAADCESPCTVTQTGVGGTNDFRCKQRSKEPDAEQICDISQTNTVADNQAIVDQHIEQNDALAGLQTAHQVALVHQSNGSGDNRLTLKQRIIQQANDNVKVGSLSQLQEAVQQAAVDQFTATGDNSADLDQNQNQHAQGKAGVQLTQMQNDQPGPSFGPIENNCLGETDDMTVDEGPNALAVVCQGSTTMTSTGKNDLKISQSLHQNGHGKALDVTQQQSSEEGGAKAWLDQHSIGVSKATVDQDENQDLKAPGVASPDQTQFGPLSVPLTLSQESNPNNTEDIDQKSVQSAGDDAEQFEDVSAACVSSGNCTIQQTVVQNGEKTENSDSGMSAEATIQCFPGEGGGSICFTGPSEDVVD